MAARQRPNLGSPALSDTLSVQSYRLGARELLLIKMVSLAAYGPRRSGKRAAAIISPIKSARVNGHDPYACLKMR